MLSQRKVFVKTLASWVGLLQSCRLTIGPLVSIMCRSLCDIIKSAKFWSSCIFLNDLCQFQLQWWLEELPNLSEYDICPEPSLVKFEFSVASDAGKKGFFAYRVLAKSRLISRPFSATESEGSFTFVNS